MSATTDSLQQRGARYEPEITGNSRLASRHRYQLARELAEGKTVLNIACGAGAGADLLATVARSVIGVDSSPDLIHEASQRYRRSNLTFRAGNGIAIPVVDGSIDLIVSFDTIEHEKHHERLMAEFRRVLVPGGLIVLGVGDPSAIANEPPVDDTVEALIQRVADLARQHLRERRRLDDLRDTVGRLHAALDEHRSEAMSAWDQVRAREEQIAELEHAHLVDLANQRASMRAALDADRKEWAAREAARDRAIAVMERSHSWRLTRPLRDLRRLVSRLVGPR
jgi:ubiquinone/menaquinone biosynthesis C-methylase UbiE